MPSAGISCCGHSFFAELQIGIEWAIAFSGVSPFVDKSVVLEIYVFC